MDTNENKEIINKLGSFIVEKRNQKNISAYFICKELGIDKSNWSRIGNGRINSIPKPETLKKIAEIINVNYLDLYKIVGFIDDETIINYIKEHKII